MALARKYQKIFGKNADATDLGVVGSKTEDNPQYSADVETLQSLSNWETGLRAIVTNSIAPYLQDHNSIFYVITSQLAYLFQAGIAEWNSQTEYVANRSVVLKSGKIYMAIANNTNVEPEVTASWDSYWLCINYWGGIQGDIYNQTDLWQILSKGLSYSNTVSTAISGYSQGTILRFFDGDASYLVSSLIDNNTEAPAKSNIKFKESDTGKKWKCIERVVVKADMVNGNWYRLYNDGWIEQGGIVNGTSAYNQPATITFEKTMSDTNYHISIFARVGRIRCGSGGDHVDIGVGTSTSTTGISLYFGGSDERPSKICWKVEGYIAEE